MERRVLTLAAWVGDLEETAMSRVFDATTLARARSYAHDAAVVRVTATADGSMVLGEVQGSRSRPYQTFLVRHDTPLRDPFGTRCSCPVGSRCKHAAALALHLQQATRAAATPEPGGWRRVLGPLVERDERQAAVPAVEGTADLGLLLRVDPGRRGWGQPAGSEVRVRATRRGVSGRWLKRESFDALRQAPIDSSQGVARGGHGARTVGHGRGQRTTRPLPPHLSLRPEHRALVDHLWASAREEGWAHPGDLAEVGLDELGPDPWAWLLEATRLGATLAPEEGARLALSAEPLELRVAVTRHDDGLHLLVDLPGVDVDTELPDDRAVEMLGDPVHTILARDTDGVVHVRPSGGDARELAPLAGAPAVVVPPEDEEEFVARYLPSLARTADLYSPDETVDVTHRSRTRLVAEVSVPEVGAVEIAWGVEQVADLADPEPGEVHPLDRSISPGEAWAAGRRLRDEQDLLAGISVLEELPDSAWSPRVDGPGWWQPPARSRYRGIDAVLVADTVLPALDDEPAVRVVRTDEVPDFREAEEDPFVRVSVEDVAGGDGGDGGDGGVDVLRGGGPEGRPEGERVGSDWFDLDVSVSVDDELVPLPDLLAALVRGDEIMIMPTGTYFTLDRPELRRLRELVEEGREIVDHPGGEDVVRISRYHVGWFDELVSLGVVESQSAAWTEQVERLRSLEIDPAPAVPDTVRAILRPYQADGYQWVSALWDAGLGGVLADDMGLGKTLQVLTALARAQQRDDLGSPVLVVAPTSVVGTWAAEAARFTPSLRVRTRPRTARAAGPLDDLADVDVLVTSYAVLRLDEDVFAAHRWRAVVLDEAHTVKNHQSKTYKAVRRLSRPVTFAVTGTPVENNLMDLWSLLSLVAPGLHPRPDRFQQEWRRPIEGGDRDLLARLRTHVRPLILRRTKEEVALDLPPKTVQVLPVTLGSTHRRIYDRHLQRERQRMLGLLDDPDGNRVAILAGLTRLRQLALDPRLVEPGSATSSAKIEVLLDHLVEIGREGHRALVFSQFTRYLGLVRERLDAAGIASSYLDGSTTDRQGVVEGFRQGDDPVFLISLKAGGVGLTLTEADYVFVLDPWWNPAAETQAIDRAHRIGQDKPVMVYRLVSEATIEDKVLALQERKRALVASVVDDDPLTGGLTAADLAGLLEPGETGRQ